MKKFRLVMEVDMLINEDMDMSNDIREDIKNGDIIFDNVNVSMIDENGQPFLDEEEHAVAMQEIMSVFKGMGGA
jgi:bacterioferritin (cytochrome b1)